ncbi:MAG: hypothetical protein VXW02_10485 [Verrucomicrobiota bacterium]|nr:hypothetical protein [Verrucomicrobiota bacterium]|tara:strand:+ start:1944 stop:3005 length:1062 start_codon:yes stop_codon:yes gene_type:complete
MINNALKTLLIYILTISFSNAADTLFLKGKDGPGKGKHIVIITGDEEYRSEESGPMLGKILSQKHGFDCTVVFSWTDGYIDPNNQKGLRGLKSLEKADLMIIGTRFRQPSNTEAVHITNYLNAGKPVIGFRTATHAFTGGNKFGTGDSAIGFGAFGRKVLGEQWVNHHGAHKREGARGVVEEKNKNHSVLNGVGDVFAPSDVYGVRHLTDQDTILLRGAVTKTMDPKSENVEGKKNDPMQALAWLHPYVAPDGKTKGEAFCTTAGASCDFVSEGLRRIVINASYHLTGLKVPEKADVDYVDPFYPSFYGFIRDKNWFKDLDMQAEDYGLGKTPHAPDPPGTPSWPHRPMPKKG